MKLTVVGCSPAWPNPGSGHSGYLVEGAGSLLLDCGPGVLARLGDETAVDAIVLTHFHLDHCGDLVPWVWRTHYLERSGRRVPRPALFIPPGGTDRLAQFGALFGEAGMFESAFSVAEYPHATAFQAAGFTITPARVPHFDAEAYALRVDSHDRSLAFSGDTAPCEGLVQLADGVDLFICEATLEAGRLDGHPRGHLTLEEAEAHHERAAAKRLLITHRPADLPAPDTHELAHDGLVLEF